MASAGGGDCEGEGAAPEADRPHQRPFLIGVSGGTASGKSTVCEKIMELLGQNEVDHRQRKLVILSQDSFYKVLTAEQKAKALKGQYNFDHPGRYRDPEDRVGVRGQTSGMGSRVGQRWR